MRADRLLSIMMLLQARGRLTARALAQELEVSERTIYRDVIALSTAGIPVYTEKGPGGGIALIDSKGQTLESNPTLQAMLGYSGAELRRMPFEKLARRSSSTSESTTRAPRSAKASAVAGVHTLTARAVDPVDGDADSGPKESGWCRMSGFRPKGRKR